MKFLNRSKPGANQAGLAVLLASSHPDPALIQILSDREGVNLREAFTTQGVMQAMPGVNLVILEEVIESSNTTHELLVRALETSGIPVTSPFDFQSAPEEWLGRARLTSARQITYLPSRQVNLVNWSGGVGKTTLAMAICKRFVERTGLPAALLELSMGGSALHARISENLPEFFAIATEKAEPTLWQGVTLYPMDGRTIDVLWSEDPDGVRRVLKEIRRKHTLFVVDCYPGHPLFPELSQTSTGMVHLVVTSPRDDAVLQAHRLMKEVSQPAHMVLNMARNLADRAESGVSVTLPYREAWAQSVDARLADPLLELVYAGWNRRKS
jgi:cellulose biosynthesis protein BcsQ